MNTYDLQIQLPNGHGLGLDLLGPEKGMPVFYFHGAPSARKEFQLFVDDALLQSLNTRLIAVDRPGMGLSKFQADRHLLDWPADIRLLADALAVDRFSILAYSLGGPYGLACAYALSDRISRTGIVSGAALFSDENLMLNVNKGTRQYLTLPRDKPLASRFFLWMMSTMARIAPKITVRQATSLLPECDRAVVADPDIQKKFIAMVRESFRQGTRGAFVESLLAVSEWGFRLQDIRSPVLLWHGEEDGNIPIEMARHAAAAIPACQAHFFPGEGHLSLFKNHAHEIIAALTQ